MNPYITEVIALDLSITSLLLVPVSLFCWWLFVPFHYIITFIQKDCNALLHFCKNSQFKHPVECSPSWNAAVIPKHWIPYSVCFTSPSSVPGHIGYLLTSASLAFHWIPSEKLIQLPKWHKTHSAKEWTFFSWFYELNWLTNKSELAQGIGQDTAPTNRS